MVGLLAGGDALRAAREHHILKLEIAREVGLRAPALLAGEPIESVPGPPTEHVVDLIDGHTVIVDGGPHDVRVHVLEDVSRILGHEVVGVVVLRGQVRTVGGHVAEVVPTPDFVSGPDLQGGLRGHGAAELRRGRAERPRVLGLVEAVHERGQRHGFGAPILDVAHDAGIELVLTEDADGLAAVARHALVVVQAVDAPVQGRPLDGGVGPVVRAVHDDVVVVVRRVVVERVVREDAPHEVDVGEGRGVQRLVVVLDQDHPRDGVAGDELALQPPEVVLALRLRLALVVPVLIGELQRAERGLDVPVVDLEAAAWYVPAPSGVAHLVLRDPRAERHGRGLHGQRAAVAVLIDRLRVLGAGRRAHPRAARVLGAIWRVLARPRGDAVDGGKSLRKAEVAMARGACATSTI